MQSLIRAVKERAKLSLHTLFMIGQHLGIDILPRHFYSGIPDIRELRNSEGWKASRSMYGVRGASVDEQLDFVRDCISDQARAILLQKNIHGDACTENGNAGFGPIEAEFLFCFISRHRPQKIIQVGAGVSTAVLLNAASTFGYHPAITCIDPYPTEYLKKLAEKGKITLIPKKCQDIDLSVFTDLGPGDLLFVDSTHTVKPGSEVNMLILEVLPRLQTGCHVHFHDIYFPYDYSGTQLTDIVFWNESDLLHAFLIGNQRYSISASLGMLHHAKSKELRILLPNYTPASMEQGLLVRPITGHIPSSTYLRVVG